MQTQPNGNTTPQPQTNWEQIDTDVEMFHNDPHDTEHQQTEHQQTEHQTQATPVTLTLPYGDAVIFEWAMYDFMQDHKRSVTLLQAKPNRTLEETTLLNIYENRIRKAKHLYHQIGAALTASSNKGE